MDLKKEAQQRNEFCNILFQLAESQDFFQDARNRSKMYERLELLYDAESPEKRFRHFYSDIFSVLTTIQQDTKGDINILGQNLEMIRKGYQPKNKSADGKRTIDISDAINKLYDHVNLDIARINYSDAADREISGESALEKMQEKINGLEYDIQDAKDDTSEVRTQLKNSQKEYIAILGIFAAVVLAFTGGIAFSTSVLENIAEASIYRTIGVSLVIGLVLINVLFGMFYYINSLVDKKNKIYPLIISNSVIILLLIGTVVAWHCGFVEDRNTRIKTPPQKIAQEITLSITQLL